VLKLIRAEWQLLLFGFLMTFWSSPGQTFLISLFSGEIRAELSLSDGEFAAIYSLATLASARDDLVRSADRPHGSEETIDRNRSGIGHRLRHDVIQQQHFHPAGQPVPVTPARSGTDVHHQFDRDGTLPRRT
jgi:hypothetical protein